MRRNETVSKSADVSHKPRSAQGPFRRQVKWGLVLSALFASACSANPKDYHGIHVVDEQTGRGVPLVELRTTGELALWTDSAGWIAFNEPGLMDRPVWFTVTSHGYEFPKDGFGFAGLKITPKPGETTTIKVARKTIAERLYRQTGGGIYRDSVLLGQPVPIKQPVLNADLLGCDSVLNVLHNGKLYWFWGDSNRVAYALGNFRTTGATSDLPSKGGLQPEEGVNFTYFKGEDGFAKQMVPSDLPGPIWLSGMFELPDESGKPRIVGHYSRMKDLGTRLSRGLVAFNEEKQIFEIIKDIDLEAPLSPEGHPTKATVDGVEYVYFNFPFPNQRVRADWKSFVDVESYEAYTPLIAGTRKLDAEHPQLDRGADGKLNWSWKKNTAFVQPREIEKMIQGGALKVDEVPFRPVDETGKLVTIAGGSFYWNEYRKKYVMIGLEVGGTSVLGEIWYAEAPKLEGPWKRAVKIATHEKYDLYNPKQHPYFDEDGGKIIYFEGTYTASFAANPYKTPRYDYNQVMYRVDLSDARLDFAKQSAAPH